MYCGIAHVDVVGLFADLAPERDLQHDLVPNRRLLHEKEQAGSFVRVELSGIPTEQGLRDVDRIEDTGRVEEALVCARFPRQTLVTAESSTELLFRRPFNTWKLCAVAQGGQFCGGIALRQKQGGRRLDLSERTPLARALRVVV